ncbi:MAG: 50S ribosomal protein L18 [Chloroflexi bacterium]|nr:50S ribosomal protein L18 [Chloroflexota bacterium]
MARGKTSRAMRLIRHHRVRRTVLGNLSRPRMAVFRSLNHIYVQVIDDGHGHTLVAASSLDPEVKSSSNGQAKSSVSKQVGALIARRAMARGITQVVLDRGGYKYHGRVKALADAAREEGLQF